MKKILLATHGKLAEGLKSAITLIVGEQDDITFINAYVGDLNFEEELVKYLAEITDEDTLIVMTVLLELALMDAENISKETILQTVQSGKDQLMLVEMDEEPEAEEDFDF